MNINRDNYEAYFLDFIEGRLSPDQEEVLRRFLKFNPDLEAEIEDIDLLKIEPTHHAFPGKNSLKKELPGSDTEVRDGNFDMFCIAYIEGDLKAKQRQIFEAYLQQYPERRSEFEACKATILKPESVPFPHKSRLKHRSRMRLTDWRIMVPIAAAAAIALMVIFRVPATQPAIEVAAVVEPEIIEKQPIEEQEEKQPEQPTQATFNMVRKTNAPVPVSDYKERQQERERQKAENLEKQQQESPRIASVDLRKQQNDPIHVEYDQIRQEIIQPPTINSSSLSILALARYQAQKASQFMEEEDALLWSLASTGLKELNRIAGSETKLMASRDEDGSISGIRFQSRFLNVTAPIARDE